MRPRVVVAAVGLAAAAAGAIALLATGPRDGAVAVPESDADATAGPGAPAALRAAPRGTQPPVERVAVRVKGRVLDRLERPVPHMPVGARWVRAAGDDAGSGTDAARFRARVATLDAPSTLVPKYELRGETDDQGAYELTIPRLGVYDFEAFPPPPACCMGTWVTVSASGAEGKTDLHVLDGSTLSGRLVDAVGRGVVGVVDGSWDLGEWGWGMDPLVTKPSGEFVVVGVPAGVGDLTLYVAGRGRLEDVRVRTPRAELLTIVVAGFGGVVKGRVRDTAGRSVAGADVMITVRGPVRDDAFANEHADRPPLGVFRARTEPDGAYRIDDAIPGRVAKVEAAAEGYTLHSSDLPLATWSGAQVAVGLETTIDLTLVRGGTIAGRVVEEGTQRPVAKATVVLQRVDAARSWPRSEPVRALSAEDGTYRIDAAPLGRWIVRGSAAGSYDVAMASAREEAAADSNSRVPPQETLVVLSREGETVEHTVVLAPGFSVHGRVVGPDGKPVEGAAIATGDDGDARLVYRWGGGWSRSDAVATTAADGTFTVAGLPPRAELTLRAKKPPLVGAPSTPFALGPGLPAPDVVLSLARGASVAGIVLDAEGKPVAEISVQGYSQGESAFARSGPDGTFLLEGLPAGQSSFSVWGDGWSQIGRPAFSLAVGERKAHVEVRVGRQVRIRGVVVDESGIGIGGVSVRARIPSADDSTDTSSDDDGTFSLDVDAGTRLDVEAESGGTKAVAPGITAPADGLRLVVKRPPTVVLEGRVTDAAGEAVPLCLVTATPPQAPEVARSEGEAAEAVGGAFRIVTTRTPPFVLRASDAKDSAGRPLNLLDAEVTVDDPARGPVTIVMKPGLEVRGRVEDEEGRGVAKATVRLSRSPDEPAVDRTSTDRDGAFAFVALAPGPCELAIEPPAPFVAPAPLSIAAGDAGMTIRLTAGASIAGRLVGPDGAPHAGTVTARWGADAGEGSPTKKVLADGRFRFDGVPRGASVDLAGFVPDEDAGEDVLLPAAAKGVHPGVVEVVLAFRRGVTIAGVVATENGRIPTDVVVRAARPGATEEEAESTEAGVGEGGAFRLAPLEPGGSWTVTVSTSGAGEIAKRANVTAPAQGVRFVVPDPDHVTGRLVGTGDLSVFTVRVWVDGRDPASADTVYALDGQGGFECDLPPNRAYRFTASSYADDRFAAVGPLAKGTSTVTLTLAPGTSIAGVVQGAAKSPGSARRISVSATSAAWCSTSFVSIDGRFILRGLPPGLYAVRAEPDGGAPATVEGVAAGTTDVVLRLP